MLENPGEEIYDIIRYFGSRKKIFNVHFRNIKGGVLDFVEVFPDEGDIDMLKAARTYKEVGYPYMLMPDHVPGIDGEEVAPSRLRLLLRLHPRHHSSGERGGVGGRFQTCPYRVTAFQETHHAKQSKKPQKNTSPSLTTTGASNSPPSATSSSRTCPRATRR